MPTPNRPKPFHSWRVWVALGLTAALLVVVFWPKSGDARTRARVALTQARWPEAEAEARQLLLAHPHDQDAQRLLVRALLPQGHAGRAWDQLRQLDPVVLTDDDLRAVADQLFSHNNPLLAQLFLDAVGSKPPSEASNRIDATIQNDAHELNRRLSGIEPPAARLRVLLAMLPIDPDDVTNSDRSANSMLRAFEQVTFPFGTATSTETIAELQARALLGLGRYRQALDVLDDERLTPAPPRLAMLRGRALLGLGDVEGAHKELDAAGTEQAEADFAFDPAPYLGSEACGRCHSSFLKSQRNTRHALTFQKPEALGEWSLPSEPIPDPVVAGVSHVLKHANGSIEASTSRSGKTHAARVLFALGSGKRGVTLVGVDESGQLRELRLSRYAAKGWDRTTGHLEHPGTSAELLGRPLSVADALSCLMCHTTEPRAARSGHGPTAADSGISCERCHGPGGNHALAAEAKFPEMAIALPAGARASEITRLCGQCHRPGNAATANPDASNAAARFQSATLPLSRCYDPAGTTLTCVACHDPHRDRAYTSRDYTEVCLACHGPSPKSSTPGRACPQNPTGDCVSCHMPKIDSTSAHTTFTDHHIRVHRSDEPAAR